MANVLSVSSPQGADRTETARGVPGCGTGCRLHDGRPDRVQPPDDLMRFVEPSHKHIARREDAVSHREARCQLERRQQVRRRVVKPAGEEVGSPLLNSQRSLPPPASVRRRASSNSSRPTSAAKTKADAFPADILPKPLMNPASSLSEDRSGIVSRPLPSFMSGRKSARGSCAIMNIFALCSSSRVAQSGATSTDGSWNCRLAMEKFGRASETYGGYDGGKS
jgi:hypothetical protein